MAAPIRRLVKAPLKKILVLYEGLPKAYMSVVMQICI